MKFDGLMKRNRNDRKRKVHDGTAHDPKRHYMSEGQGLGGFSALGFMEDFTTDRSARVNLKVQSVCSDLDPGNENHWTAFHHLAGQRLLICS